MKGSGVVAIDEPHFYRLGFASQMIIWAMRKRLHLLAQGDSERNVTEVFAKAGFGNVHATLMSVLDVMLCGAPTRVQVHAVACPCLSPHEISLLNALAYRQRNRDEQARQSLSQLFCAAAVRLVEPAVAAIVEEFDARRLQLTSIETAVSTGATSARAEPPIRSLPRHVTVH